MGMAGGAANTFRQLGFALGIPAVGTILSGVIADKLADGRLFPHTDALADLVTGGQSAAVLASVPGESRAAAQRVIEDAYAAGLDRVFLAGGLLAVVAGLLVLLVVRGSAAQPATDSTSAAADLDKTPEGGIPAV
jgi:hypothetical protein